MTYLRVRKIGIDAIPDGEPFISVSVEKLVTDADGNVIQTIGNFDRMYKKLSDVNLVAAGTICDDGVIDPIEIYTILANVCYTWLIQKYGGKMVEDKLVI